MGEVWVGFGLELGEILVRSGWGLGGTWVIFCVRFWSDLGETWVRLVWDLADIGVRLG